MVDDLDEGKVGQGHSEHMSCSQMEPHQALCEVHSGVLRSLLRKFREQMKQVMNMHVNQVLCSVIHSQVTPGRIHQS